MRYDVSTARLRAGCDGPYSAIVATDCANEVRKRTGSLIARAPRRAAMRSCSVARG
jgi:hypothetical protein